MKRLIFVCLLSMVSAQAFAEEPAGQEELNEGAAPAEAPEQEGEAAPVAEAAPITRTPVAEVAPVVLPELKLHASIRPRLEARFGHQFGLEADQLRYAHAATDSSDLFSQQSRVGVSYSGQRLKMRSTIQFAQVWGSATNVQLHPSPVQLYDAYLDFAFVEGLTLRAGRFEIAYGEQRLLGSVGWSQVGRTWDGLRLRADVSGPKTFVDVFFARNADGGAGTRFLENDGLLGGAYAHFENVPGLAELDVYVLGDAQLSHLGGDAAHRRLLLTPGLRAKFVKSQFDAVLEGGFQAGSACVQDAETLCTNDSVDSQAWFTEVQTGFAFSKFRAFAGGSIASGDDPDTAENEAFNQLYPTGHAHIGWMDFFARSNIIDVYAGLSGKFEQFSFLLKAHEFQRVQPDAERLGNEINAQILVPLPEKLSFEAGYGLFIPADGMASSGDPSGAAHWLFTQLIWVY